MTSYNNRVRFLCCLDGSIRFQPRPSPVFPVTNPTATQVAQTKKDDDWFPQNQAKGNLVFDVGMLALIHMTEKENVAV